MFKGIFAEAAIKWPLILTKTAMFQRILLHHGNTFCIVVLHAVRLMTEFSFRTD